MTSTDDILFSGPVVPAGLRAPPLLAGDTHRRLPSWVRGRGTRPGPERTSPLGSWGGGGSGPVEDGLLLGEEGFQPDPVVVSHLGDALVGPARSMMAFAMTFKPALIEALVHLRA